MKAKETIKVDTAGSVSIEYGLICVVIAVGLLTVLSGLGGEMTKPFDTIKSTFENTIRP